MVALSAIGYADGVNIHASEHGHVIIHGCKCPIIGRISMDQFMIDVTDVPDAVSAGDEVVLFGEQSGSSISLHEYCTYTKCLLRESVQCISVRVQRTWI